MAQQTTAHTTVVHTAAVDAAVVHTAVTNIATVNVAHVDAVAADPPLSHAAAPNAGTTRAADLPAPPPAAGPRPYLLPSTTGENPEGGQTHTNPDGQPGSGPDTRPQHRPDGRANASLDSRPALGAEDTSGTIGTTPGWGDGAIHLHRSGERLLLSAQLDWQLPQAVEEALPKGIPVQFIAEVQLQRKRWYWANQELLTARRYYRLSYQPLTRRWRIHTGSTPLDRTGQGLALGVHYTRLPDALAAMQRLSGWDIGPAAVLPATGAMRLELRFRIDLSQFPRPLQIGALGRTDWNLLVTRELHLQAPLP